MGTNFDSTYSSGWRNSTSSLIKAIKNFNPFKALVDPLFHITNPDCKHKQFCWADTVQCIGCKEFTKKYLEDLIMEMKKKVNS